MTRITSKKQVHLCIARPCVIWKMLVSQTAHFFRNMSSGVPGPVSGFSIASNITSTSYHSYLHPIMFPRCEDSGSFCPSHLCHHSPRDDVISWHCKQPLKHNLADKWWWLPLSCFVTGSEKCRGESHEFFGGETYKAWISGSRWRQLFEKYQYMLGTMLPNLYIKWARPQFVIAIEIDFDWLEIS